MSNAIMTAMAINIHERFQNATQFKEALLKERKVEPVETVRRKSESGVQPALAFGIAAVVVLLCIFSGNLAKNKAEVLLEPAEISVWYPVGADGDTSSVRDQGMQAVLEALQGDQFNSVTVTLRPIPEDVYSETLRPHMMPERCRKCSPARIRTRRICRRRVVSSRCSKMHQRIMIFLTRQWHNSLRAKWCRWVSIFRSSM